MKYLILILAINFTFSCCGLLGQEEVTRSDSLAIERIEFEKIKNAQEDSIKNLNSELKLKESEYRYVKASQLEELVKAASKIPQYKAILNEYETYRTEAKKEIENYEGRVKIYQDKEQIYNRQIKIHDDRIIKLEGKVKVLKAKNKLNKIIYGSVGIVGGFVVGWLISK